MEDLAEAERSLLSYIQRKSFRDEVTSLQKSQPVKRSSRIYKLDPILQNGIIRVGGRLSKLAMPEKQKVADLPLICITPDLPPFTHTGVIKVKNGCSRVKRYGALFTCLSSRAVHLEMAYSLDTDSCISALRRVICRRGQVKEIVSDNGTNFVGTECELREAFAQLNLNKIQRSIHAEGIKWSFNPPYSSHHGGVWERLIRTVKKILYSITKEQTMDDEGLQTALCEVEANDRPITVLSDDPKDPEPLTPNHLRQMRGMPTLPPASIAAEDGNRSNTYQTSFGSAGHGSIPLMQERQKWNEVKGNLKPGNIMLIIDESSPRNSWPMGRITETFTDKDKDMYAASRSGHKSPLPSCVS